MHVGIAHPRWRGKRSRHSRRMRTRNFAYLARGPCNVFHHHNKGQVHTLMKVLCLVVANESVISFSQNLLDLLVLWSHDLEWTGQAWYLKNKVPFLVHSCKTQQYKADGWCLLVVGSIKIQVYFTHSRGDYFTVKYMNAPITECRWISLGLYSLSGKTSYRQISWSTET